MNTSTKLITYESSLAMPESRFEEVVDGELLVMPPPTKQHNAIVRFLQKSLDRQMRQGLDLTWETGFLIEQIPVLRYRVPDLAVLESGALMEDRRANPDPYVRVPPELIIEVLSPSNRKGNIETLLADYGDLQAEELVLVYPAQASFVSYVRRESGLREDREAASGRIRFARLPEVEIDLDQIWRLE